MMIGKPDRADDVPACGCEVREKPLRACDAGDGEHARSAVGTTTAVAIESCCGTSEPPRRHGNTVDNPRARPMRSAAESSHRVDQRCVRPAAAVSGSRSRPDRHRLVVQIALVNHQQVDVAAPARDAETHRRAGGRVAPSRSSASRPERYRLAPTSTGTPGNARASISGSSPADLEPARTAAPSDTTVTPSCGLRRP